MDKTLQEMQIEVARYWAGVDEMKGCLNKVHKGTHGGIYISTYPHNHTMEPGWQDKPIGPYLKIEDGNPWSSATILARCGKSGNGTISEFLSWWVKKKSKLSFAETMPIIENMLNNGYIELANNLALQWLHKNAHDVWLKGMELCS